jgi:beta-lactam-binding protein with PASTA domain
VAGGTVTGPATVLTGGTATVTVTAGAGYSVGSVTATNGSVTATAPYVLSGVTANTTVTATFTADANDITYLANPVAGGTVTGPATVLTGGTATVAVSANSGYGIDAVTASNGSVTATAPYVLSGVTADTTVTAVFRQLAAPVPNVVGQVRTAAEAAITAAGFTVGTITEVFSASTPSGTVIAQAPMAGVLALPGTAVGLVVSKGPQPVSVPNVVGMAAAAARAALTGAGLVVGTETEAFSSTAPLGSVMGQTPAGGASVPPGSAVDIVISKGPSTIMPNVLGMTRAAAESAIENAILTVGLVVEDYSDTVPAGQVLSQSPAGGTEIAQGVAVSFVISLGPRAIVPNVSDLNLDEAQAAITAAGLQVQTTEESSETAPAGQVLSQTPEPGLTVAQGSTVYLVVSSGPEDNGCGCAGCQAGKGRFTLDSLRGMLGNLLVLGLSVMVLTAMSRFKM